MLVMEEWEDKVGWSTNTVKLGKDEYLVGWHGVGKEDIVYRNGLAIVSSSGDLLGITDYLLEPRDVYEFYGDRPGVIFGCGLILRKDELYWVGGLSDYGIGIYTTELPKILENIRWIIRS
ncbi:MAG: hypothetical protein JZD40_01835 [Sulfolobus sp.]|nr:hypothetical protein [Sulfolobus sp.]